MRVKKKTVNHGTGTNSKNEPDQKDSYNPEGGPVTKPLSERLGNDIWDIR